MPQANGVAESSSAEDVTVQRNMNLNEPEPTFCIGDAKETDMEAQPAAIVVKSEEELEDELEASRPFGHSHVLKEKRKLALTLTAVR